MRDTQVILTAHEVKKELEKNIRQDKAVFFPKFFKTNKGEYGEGDVFIGVTVPLQRQIAKKYKFLPLHEVEILLKSAVHEHRLTALLILIIQFIKSNDAAREALFRFYVKNIEYVNNWDLVDTSAAAILGTYAMKHPEEQDLIESFAHSKVLWKRRIAMISTFAFIKENKFNEALHIATLLLEDKEDLIHKAVGWMLREIGNRNQEEEEKFLRKNARKMPRTMLRYAIEKFNEEKRKSYLAI